tara:strand:- start:1473 stop:1799 length:327 start_codon:yes stop_codon:yes gene_type:complete
MLKVVENIQEIEAEEVEDTSKLSLDNQFLKNVSTGTRLLLRNLDGSNQFVVEIMNNAKLKKGQVEPNPFRRSVYARGYQGFLTHDNGKPKLQFDDKNWITFDLASFST